MDNLTIITKEFEKMKGQYVLSHCEAYRLIGVVDDEKYFKLLEFGNGKDLPDMINTNTKKL